MSGDKTAFSTSLAVTATIGATGVFDVSEFTRLTVYLGNAGAALTAFQIRGSSQSPETASPAMTILKSASGDFTSPDGKLLLAASGNLTVLADAATGYFSMNCEGLRILDIRATAGSATTLTIRGVGERMPAVVV